MKRQQEPTEQLLTQEDYGGIYKSRNSPQQNMTLRVDGGSIAIAIALVALGGVLVAAIMLPQIMRAQAEAAAAPAKAQASYAERDARVALDYVTSVQSSLEKNGISIKPPNGH